MSDSSMSRVTITLGRSGQVQFSSIQFTLAIYTHLYIHTCVLDMYVCFCLVQVVKRAGAVLESAYTDPIPSVGVKRSVHDRLGTNVELNSKRCFFCLFFLMFRFRDVELCSLFLW